MRSRVRSRHVRRRRRWRTTTCTTSGCVRCAVARRRSSGAPCVAQVAAVLPRRSTSLLPVRCAPPARRRRASVMRAAMYRYISRESCSQCDSPPLTSLTICTNVVASTHDRAPYRFSAFPLPASPLHLVNRSCGVRNHLRGAERTATGTSQQWACHLCTYLNTQTKYKCQMCGTQRRHVRSRKRRRSASAAGASAASAPGLSAVPTAFAGSRDSGVDDGAMARAASAPPAAPEPLPTHRLVHLGADLGAHAAGDTSPLTDAFAGGAARVTSASTAAPLPHGAGACAGAAPAAARRTTVAPLAPSNVVRVAHYAAAFIYRYI